MNKLSMPERAAINRGLVEGTSVRITSKTHVTGRSLLLSSKSGGFLFPLAPVDCGMTRPRRDAPPNWRTAGRLLDRAEVAAIMGTSTNRVEAVVKRTHKLSPRRSRWTPDAVIAALESLVYREPVGTMGFLAAMPGVLTEAQVAHVLRCAVAVVPWLDLEPLPPGGVPGVHYALGDLKSWLQAHER
jgi:hypothetical protein